MTSTSFDTSTTQEPGGSVHVRYDGDTVVVCLAGVVDQSVHDDVSRLVQGLRGRDLPDSGPAVLVHAAGVTALQLQGVWLLLELRRWARGREVVLVDPAGCVTDSIGMHGLRPFLVERTEP